MTAAMFKSVLLVMFITKMQKPEPIPTWCVSFNYIVLQFSNVRYCMGFLFQYQKLISVQESEMFCFSFGKLHVI